MTPQEFINLNLKNNQKVKVTFHKAGPQKAPRTVVLFFRGFAPMEGKSVIRSTDDMVPLFSPPGKKGINHNYYKGAKCTFENIESVEIL